MSAGLLNDELFVAPSRPIAMLALVGVVLITIGVIDYVGTEPAWRNGSAFWQWAWP
jgi:hypothetical protein